MRFVILGSGRGSNAEALLRAWKAGELGSAMPVGLISDRPEARILTLGETYGVRADYLPPGTFKTKLEGAAEEAYIAHIQGLQADLVVLAGFMRILKARFLEAFAGKMINIHPSLLPAFPGKQAILDAWNHGVKITGCTVHLVVPEVDAGPILDQEPVRREPADTLETLEAKLHAAEHRLLPRVVRRWAEKPGVF